MQINITFFVQIINFSITYFFLNKILFKSVVRFLQKREMLKVGLIRKIGEKEQELDELYSQKASDMLQFQAHIAKKYRFTRFIPQDIPLQVKYQKDIHAFDLLVKKGSELILKEVSNACRS